MKPIRLFLSISAFVCVTAGCLGFAPAAMASSSPRVHINCSNAAGMCTEVADSDDVFGHYVGHDEPSVLFDSNVRRVREPPALQHHAAHRPIGEQPERPRQVLQLRAQRGDLARHGDLRYAVLSRAGEDLPARQQQNILDPAVSPKHVGQAYMEMQFYPPGWVPWPTWQVAVGASSCDPTQWCAALNIDSLAQPVTNQVNNATCLSTGRRGVPSTSPSSRRAASRRPGEPGRRDDPRPSRPTGRRPVHELRRPSSVVDHGHAERGQSDDQRPHNRPVGLDDGERRQRLRAGEVRPRRHVLQGDPVRVPPDVLHVDAEDPGDVGGGLLQRRLRHRDRPLPDCAGPVAIPARSSVSTRWATSRPVPPAIGRTPDPKLGPDGRGRLLLLPRVGGPHVQSDRAARTRTPDSTACSYQAVWPDGNTDLHPTSFKFSSPTTGPHYNIQIKNPAIETDLPGGRVEYMRHRDKAWVHADTDNRHRSAGRVLSVLHDIERLSAAVSGSSETTSPARRTTSAATPGTVRSTDRHTRSRAAEVTSSSRTSATTCRATPARKAANRHHDFPRAPPPWRCPRRGGSH